jgi:GNAT superfamily N-acetyltransferase
MTDNGPAADSLAIRRGVAADAPQLAAFAARTFAETFGADNNPDDLRLHLKSSFGLDQQTRELLDPNEITLLAYRDEVLVGFAQVRRNAPPPGVVLERPIELHRFYVDRPAHGKGVAQRLMRAARQAAAGFEGRQLWLGVWEKNPRAIAFYQKVGFVIAGSTIFIVGSDPQTDRVMVANVVPAALSEEPVEIESIEGL